MKQGLNETPWHIVLGNCDDVNEMVYTFTNILNGICSELIPNYIVNIDEKGKQGMTNKIKKLFKNCNKLHKKFKLSSLDTDKAIYVSARNEAKNQWRKAKYNHFLKINEKMMNSESSSKQWWKIARGQLGVGKNRGVDALLDNNVLVLDDTDKCNLFNRYFLNEATLLVNKEDADRVIIGGSHLPELNCLSDIEIREDDIEAILKKLDPDKASGIDGKSNKVLKMCHKELSVPLALIFKKAMDTQTFPNSWKQANVVPIFKKGDRNLTSNYRPVSLLSTVSKVFERIIYNKIYDFCLKNNILTYKKSGFIKRDSTINQLIHLTIGADSMGPAGLGPPNLRALGPIIRLNPPNI